MERNRLPEKQGLYDPQFEKGSCAAGSDPETGDGAGVTLQIPYIFFQEEQSYLGVFEKAIRNERLTFITRCKRIMGRSNKVFYWRGRTYQGNYMRKRQIGNAGR